MRYSELKKLSQTELQNLALELWDKLKAEEGKIDLGDTRRFSETRSDLNRVIGTLDKLKGFTSPWSSYDGIEQNTLNWIKG